MTIMGKLTIDWKIDEDNHAVMLDNGISDISKMVKYVQEDRFRPKIALVIMIILTLLVFSMYHTMISLQRPVSMKLYIAMLLIKLVIPVSVGIIVISFFDIIKVLPPRIQIFLPLLRFDSDSLATVWLDLNYRLKHVYQGEWTNIPSSNKFQTYSTKIVNDYYETGEITESLEHYMGEAYPITFCFVSEKERDRVWPTIQQLVTSLSEIDVQPVPDITTRYEKFIESGSAIGIVSYFGFYIFYLFLQADFALEVHFLSIVASGYFLVYTKTSASIRYSNQRIHPLLVKHHAKQGDEGLGGTILLLPLTVVWSIVVSIWNLGINYPWEPAYSLSFLSVSLLVLSLIKWIVLRPIKVVNMRQVDISTLDILLLQVLLALHLLS